MIANGAQRVRAHDIPTMPISVVAAPMDVTIRVENMHVANMQWEISHARLSVSQGITRLSRSRDMRVEYDFWDLCEIAEEGAS